MEKENNRELEGLKQSFEDYSKTYVNVAAICEHLFRYVQEKGNNPEIQRIVENFSSELRKKERDYTKHRNLIAKQIGKADIANHVKNQLIPRESLYNSNDYDHIARLLQNTGFEKESIKYWYKCGAPGHASKVAEEVGKPKLAVYLKLKSIEEYVPGDPIDGYCSFKLCWEKAKSLGLEAKLKPRFLSLIEHTKRFWSSGMFDEVIAKYSNLINNIEVKNGQ